MNILLNLFFVLAIFILIRYSSMKQMLKRLLLLCGLLALIVGAAALPEFLTPGYVVKIQACNEKNPAAEGTEIWLCEVVVNGVSHKPEEIFSPGWICERGFLIWRNYQRPEGMRDEIQAVFSGGEQVELVFRADKWRGKAYIETGSGSEVVDFYLDTESDGERYRYSVPAAPPHTSSQAVILYALLSLFFLTQLCRLYRRLRLKWSDTEEQEPSQNMLPTVQTASQTGLVRPFRTRILWLDCLKVISAFMIVSIHTSGTYFNQTPLMSRSWWGMLLVNAVPRFAVPCFLMVSGILYMKREPSIRHSFRQAGHTAIVLLFWSVIYIVAKKLLWHGPEDVVTEILKIPFSQVTLSLWYGYALIWLFLLMPFWQLLYQTISSGQKCCFIAITLLFPAILDWAGRLLSLGNGGFAPFGSRTLCLNYVGLLFLGAFLNDIFISRPKKTAALCGFLGTAVGLSLMLWGSWYLAFVGQKTSHDFLGEIRLPAILYGAGILLLFYSLSEIGGRLFPSGIKAAFYKLSRLSLGIYFSHSLIIWCIPEFILGSVFLSRTAGIKDVMVLTCIYFGLSACGAFFMSEIPVFKKMVS